MKHVKAVFIDIDDTLYPTHAFSWEGRRKAVAAMIDAGLKADPDDIMNRLHKIVEQTGSNRTDHFDRLLAQLPQQTYAPVNPAIIIAAAIVTYHNHKTRDLFPYDDAPTFLEWLKERDLRLGIITSGVPVKQAEKLIRLRLLDYFEPELVFIADQLGFDKKTSGLYQMVLGTSGLKEGEAVYIGDHPVHDIDAANSAGFITVLMDRAGHYSGMKGETEPDYSVTNFLDLMDNLASIL